MRFLRLVRLRNCLVRLVDGGVRVEIETGVVEAFCASAAFSAVSADFSTTCEHAPSENCLRLMDLQF